MADPRTGREILEAIGSIVRLFRQSEVWVDRNGAHHQIDKMSLGYLGAVQKFIENRVVEYREAVDIYDTASLVAADASHDAAEMRLSDLERGRERSDAAWLADQPLYRRISELLGDLRFKRADGSGH